MLEIIYPVISWFVIIITVVYVTVMLLRVILSFSDPNPFGKIGRFEYQLKKNTNQFVQPFADLLFRFRIDKRYAPLISAFVAVTLAFFSLQIVWNTLFVIGGIIRSSTNGNAKALLGYLLYGALSFYILLIFIRIISSWFVFSRSKIFIFARKATDPILIPFQKMIPPVGMIDLSAMIVLIIISILQGFIQRFFIAG